MMMPPSTVSAVTSIHQQQPGTRACGAGLHLERRWDRIGRSQNPEKAGRLEARFALFHSRHGIVQQRRARGVGSHSVAQIRRANENAGVDVAVEQEHAHGAAVPAARVWNFRFAQEALRALPRLDVCLPVHDDAKGNEEVVDASQVDQSHVGRFVCSDEGALRGVQNSVEGLAQPPQGD